MPLNYSPYNPKMNYSPYTPAPAPTMQSSVKQGVGIKTTPIQSAPVVTPTPQPSGYDKALTDYMNMAGNESGFLNKLKTALQEKYNYNKDLVSRQGQLRSQLYGLGAEPMSGVPTSDQARTPNEILNTIKMRNSMLVEQLNNVEGALNQRGANIKDVVDNVAKEYEQQVSMLKDLIGYKWNEGESQRKLDYEKQLKALGLGEYKPDTKSGDGNPWSGYPSSLQEYLLGLENPKYAEFLQNKNNPTKEEIVNGLNAMKLSGASEDEMKQYVYLSNYDPTDIEFSKFFPAKTPGVNPLGVLTSGFWKSMIPGGTTPSEYLSGKKK